MLTNKISENEEISEPYAGKIIPEKSADVILAEKSNVEIRISGGRT